MVTQEIRHIDFIPGKTPPTTDSRTLKMRMILRAGNLPTVPPTFDLDTAYPGLKDIQVFLNNRYGDCVTAQHAHQEYRFEFFEQKKQITITDNDVSTEYFKETGGSDTGLNMLQSLKIWRQTGFPIGSQIYKIHAYASIDWTNHNEVMLGCMLFNGVCFGMQVPQSAMNQTNEGLPWTVVSNDGGNAGGHAVYMLKWLKIVSINEIGPVILTWGIYQQATWAFWDKYVDEAFVIIDERDSWVDQATDPLDIPALEAYLTLIGGVPSNAITVTTTSVPNGTVGKAYSAQLNATGGTLPYVWSIYSGTLNPGLSLSQGGVIKGKPTKAGTKKVTFLVADKAGNKSGVILNVTVKKKTIFGKVRFFGGK